MIDVTVSPSRFRKMSTSLAESTVECCLWFFCHSSFFLFFFFAEYCKTVCQVVVFVPAMLRLLLHTRTYMLIFYILFLLLMLLIIWMSVKNNTSTAPDWNSLQQRAAVSYLAVFIWLPEARHVSLVLVCQPGTEMILTVWENRNKLRNFDTAAGLKGIVTKYQYDSRL